MAKKKTAKKSKSSLKSKATSAIKSLAGVRSFKGGKSRKKSSVWYAREIERLKLKKKYDKLRLRV